MKMVKDYFVLHEIDRSGISLSLNNHKRELYDRLTNFNSLEKARKFAIKKLHESPIIVYRNFLEENIPISNNADPYLFAEYLKHKYRIAYKKSLEEGIEISNNKKPYIIALYFGGKYQSHDYAGGSDSVPTNELVRCNKKQLENILKKVVKEEPGEINMGVEVKLF